MSLLLCKFRWNIWTYIQAWKYIRRRKLFNRFVQNKSSCYSRFLTHVLYATRRGKSIGESMHRTLFLRKITSGRVAELSRSRSKVPSWFKETRARTLTTRKRCADYILKFRISLLRWWSELYGQASRGYAHFIPRLRRDFKFQTWTSEIRLKIQIFGLQTSDLRLPIAIFDIMTFLEIFVNIPPGIKTLKRCLKGLGFERANKMNVSRLEDIAAAMSEPRTTSGSQLLTYLRCFQTTLFILRSVLYC